MELDGHRIFPFNARMKRSSDRKRRLGAGVLKNSVSTGIAAAGVGVDSTRRGAAQRQN